ncbi:hypothetical protein EF847_06760 [Actinobacteria bacterium YIM 96077]|uniref:AbiEi antitoxin N-terminal domain-containing protein n=1 Tax=Phytoactinopolyspora halophila TaxID=1981511 RepID=A0A329QAL3_9ACTN|nr:type IV toxin-antitoxin system AbiEi family antitoxin domain-containing protein [Phytoactinopolyspora halophila]AYY12451.1 hypothetical protein EF847_06760 [Actinobacteria bacterium YIM 96077]RAW09267.1 hypothetical protein DPM12_21955 [Phytoactinopolyspora halophila]
MARRPRTRLPGDISTLLWRGDGLLDLPTARTFGVSPDRLRRLARSGLLVRLAEGVYASAETMPLLDEWERHALMARAFVLSCHDAYATGWSAVINWGLPTLGRPPELPIVMRPKLASRGTTFSTYGRIVTAALPPHHRWQRRGIRLVSQAWAAATVALNAPVAAALIVADAVARREHDLAEAVRQMSRWPGVTRARWVAEHADPLAESPVETLGRFAIIAGGLPRAVSNAWVGMERPEFRVDGLWPYHHAAHEADGSCKYNNRPDAAKVVAQEKEREWRLRRLGLDIVRYDFALAAYRRADLIRRFHHLLRDNPPSTAPIRWWKHVPGVGPVEPRPGDWPSPYPVATILPPGWYDERR